MVHTYEITGMHCQNCVDKITKAFKLIEHVTNVNITLNPPEASVEMSAHLPTEVLNNAVSSLGKYTLKEKVVGSSAVISEKIETKESLTPLFIIVSYIVGGVMLRALVSRDYSLHTLMENFMGGFFVVFSLFKMLDLSGFADGYSSYDIVAKRSRFYALSYPFIELALGMAYFAGFNPFTTNIITLVLMIIGTIGVAKALIAKRTIQCACLGTALKLPMTKVTLAEDVLMGAMALLMLLSIKA